MYSWAGKWIQVESKNSVYKIFLVKAVGIAAHPHMNGLRGRIFLHSPGGISDGDIRIG
jgi:hypothetical protein